MSRPENKKTGVWETRVEGGRAKRKAGFTVLATNGLATTVAPGLGTMHDHGPRKGRSHFTYTTDVWLYYVLLSQRRLTGRGGRHRRFVGARAHSLAIRWVRRAAAFTIRWVRRAAAFTSEPGQRT